MLKQVLIVCLLLFTAIGASFAQGKRDSATIKKRESKTDKIQYGTASFYANKFQGRMTANGELFDQNKWTCAHNSLPFGTWVKVTNLRNGRSAIVRVTDRLHYKNPRLVDLSRIAATKLGYVKRGLTRVKLVVLGKKKPEDMAEEDETK